jgi:hypothetical protein
VGNKRDSNSYKRKKKYIRPSPFFIIVCEGKVTEPDYFKGFPYTCLYRVQRFPLGFQLIGQSQVQHHCQPLPC